MQKVKMLKTLHGVRAGEIYPRKFEQGMAYEVNDSLALGFMEQGGCELIGEEHTPAGRQTKVVEPDETKAAKPLNKMSKAELVAHALGLGLELVPDTMTVKAMIAEIEAAAKGAGAE